MKIGETDVHVQGAGAETIVFVHGWPDTHRLWDAQVAALCGRYRCVRFTLPGFDPAHERRVRTLDELTDFLRQVVETVSPDRPVILLLHDWGCVFGYEFALRYPSLVARIVGVDIGDPWSLARALGGMQKLMVMGYQLTLALAWRLPPRLGDAVTRRLAHLLGYRLDLGAVGSRMNYPYYMMWFGGTQAYRRRLRAFTPPCPMLFLYGRRKPMMFHATEWSAALARRPGCAVVEFEAGHWLMTKDPERFNEVVGRWLEAAPG